MTVPKIDKGIPLPPVRRYGPHAPVKTLIARLEVGDSFEVEGVPVSPSGRAKYREPRIHPPHAMLKRAREFGIRLYYAPVTEGSRTLRVWRTH